MTIGPLRALSFYHILDVNKRHVFAIASPSSATFYFKSAHMADEFERITKESIHPNDQGTLQTRFSPVRMYHEHAVSWFFDDPVAGHYYFPQIVSRDFDSANHFWLPLKYEPEFNRPNWEPLRNASYSSEAYYKAHAVSLATNQSIIDHLRSVQEELANGHLSAKAADIAEKPQYFVPAASKRLGLISKEALLSGHPRTQKTILHRVGDLTHRWTTRGVPLCPADATEWAPFLAEISLHRWLHWLGLYPAKEGREFERKQGRRSVISDVIQKLEEQQQYNRQVLDELTEQMNTKRNKGKK